MLSAGPGRPDRTSDFGLCKQVIAHESMPILGVCLGHQGLGVMHGARLEPAPQVMHGYRSRLFHSGDELMKGVPQGSHAVRYHSFCLTKLPDVLERIAWSDDDVTMAIRVAGQQRWGVQFHPESILTPFGSVLVKNFLVASYSRNALVLESKTERGLPRPRLDAPRPQPYVLSRAFDKPLAPEAVFDALYRSLDAFWLDGEGDARARYTYMGELGAPIDVATLRERASRPRHLVQRGDGFESVFRGGWLCALAYEAMRERVIAATDSESIVRRVDRWIGWDHQSERVGFFALVHDSREAQAAEFWFGETTERLLSLRKKNDRELSHRSSPQQREDLPEVTFSCSDETYRQRVEQAKESLFAGESYELCLTAKASFAIEDDPLDYYLRLRRLNPAPYAAFVRAGARAIASVSPELFLHVDESGVCRARPIKGTQARSSNTTEDQALAAELRMPRFVAENLMIVDLLRNDLGKVCTLGSVQVPRLMEVESHPNVHQLVSTIEGTLREGLTVFDAIAATFPGGSMTGAPKVRSMQILEQLEDGPRGLYAGALGYVGSDGTAMLSIVIRTAVFDEKRATAGSGGAIVMASDPEEELQEAKTKIMPLLACRHP